MSVDIKVGQAGIEALIADMEAGLNKMRGRLADMGSELKGALAGEWEGAASAAYDTAQANWNKQIDECGQLLNDIKLAVAQSKEDYLAGEMRNTNMWNG